MKITVNFDRALIERAVQAGGRKGTFDALDHLRTVSMDVVPLDMGTLKASADVDVNADGSAGTVSYDTPYATIQHENTHYRHQRGREAKYLGNPAKDPSVQRQMADLMAAALRDSLGG